MASVELTQRGTLFDLVNRTTHQVVFISEGFLTGVGVGGGPVIPDGQPPGTWGGGNVPMPSPPISNVPGVPGYRPPHVEHPIPPLPGHPIVLPPDRPTDPPIDPPTNPADPQWSWAWNPNTGWIPAYVPGDKPRPIPTPPPETAAARRP